MQVQHALDGFLQQERIAGPPMTHRVIPHSHPQQQQQQTMDRNVPTVQKQIWHVYSTFRTLRLRTFNEREEECIMTVIRIWIREAFTKACSRQR